MTDEQRPRSSYPLSPRIAKLTATMRWVFLMLTVLSLSDFVAQVQASGVKSAWLTGLDAMLCAGLCLVNVSVYRRHRRAVLAQTPVEA
ncbi:MULTISPECIES: hypothetical protein [unclassified Streptomyces]|uniref:hypothetical protein n=1 Tax=unclassified Streptomyces TaxID=2593676 RepID=UPI000DB9499B|nr:MULTISPECIES: hypothetical protein [unclassified Streptomyces]MYT68227.1 hypothetical protein [Streptomyces sp. SID8367]RAJ76859.1 hypothetical protein K377_06027 [Streptomyces sp. PsTaAH-137]